MSSTLPLARDLDIPGTRLISLHSFRDARGSFVKTFHADWAKPLDLPTPAEEFVSVSNRGVVRGMHFQTPPYDHEKVVTCLAGKVVDVLVDLRVGSPTFRRAIGVELSAETPALLIIPRGLAHGFQALTDEAMMLYRVTTVHAPAHDSGILWNSIDFDWPIADPLVSTRDSAFPALDTFSSPFRFRGES